MFSRAYINKFTVCMMPSDKIAQSKRSTSLGASLTEAGNRPSFGNIMLL